MLSTLQSLSLESKPGAAVLVTRNPTPLHGSLACVRAAGSPCGGGSSAV